MRICLKNKQNIDAIVLPKGFIEDLGSYYESSLNGVFMHFRHPLHIRQSMIFSGNISNTKFNFQVSYIFIINNIF